MLTPLEQWYCDGCGNPIDSARKGCVEWIVDEDVAEGFRIVHLAWASPRRPGGHCSFHAEHGGRRELTLDAAVGPVGLATLLSVLDLGPVHDPDQERTLRARDVREFVDILRRLLLPHYEEARTLWGLATEDGFFEDGKDEIQIYAPDTLKALIARYSGD